MSTIIHRIVGNSIHFLNYSSGETRTLNKGDGLRFLARQSRALHYDLAEARMDSRLTKNNFWNRRRCRQSLLDLGERHHFPTIAKIDKDRPFSPGFPAADQSIAPLDVNFSQLSLAKINEIFDDLVNLGVFLVVLNGEDPFLVPQFQKILDLAAERGLVMEIDSPLVCVPEWFYKKNAAREPGCPNSGPNLFIPSDYP